jgi:hypothetical protein
MTFFAALQIEDQYISLGKLGKPLGYHSFIAVQKGHIVVCQNAKLPFCPHQNLIAIDPDATGVTGQIANLSAVVFEPTNLIFSALIADQRIGLQIHFSGQGKIRLPGCNHKGLYFHTLTIFRRSVPISAF